MKSMESKSSLMLGFVAVLGTTAIAQAYELGTHSRLTHAAFNVSVLNESSFQQEVLGIRNGLDPFGAKYFDVSGLRIEERLSHAFEERVIKGRMPETMRPLSIEGWLMRGAIREDDLGTSLGFDVGKDPHDDPYGSIFRVLHHFYDPISSAPLTTGSGVLGRTAPDWALGMLDAFDDPGQEDFGRRNHFTVLDAREAMYRALTGKTRDGASAGPNEIVASHATRKAYWATTFRALGDVLHLNQDMLQPQHTRNDPHAGVPGFGFKSIYEGYVECRAVNDASILISLSGASVCRDLILGGYPIPTFGAFRDFFSTRAASDLRGAADYSNRGFFSSGTNLGENAYTSPSNDRDAYQLQQIGLATMPDGYDTLTFPLFMLSGTVFDSYTGEAAENVPLTTDGLWLGPLRRAQIALLPGGYTLTRPNYDAMADLLIPRAVAYSAGLLNYFFRGRLEIAVPDNRVYAVVDHGEPGGNLPISGGFRLLRVQVRNVTPAIEEATGVLPQHMNGGRLQAVVKFNRNLCYVSDLSEEYGAPGQTPQHRFEHCRNPAEEIAVSSATLDAVGNPVAEIALNAGEQQLFQFEFAQLPIPIDATDIHLQVVYRGALGSEADAVVVATKNLSEPNYVQVHNITDYVACIGGSWYRNNADGSLTAEQLARIAQEGESPVEFAPVTYARLSMSLQNTITPFAAPLVEKTGLAPREFLRVAFLTDNDTPLAQNTYTIAVSIEGYDFIRFAGFIATNERVVTDEFTTDAYMNIFSMRGTLGTVFSGAYHRGSGALCDSSPASALFSAAFNQNPTLPTLVTASAIHQGS